MAKCSHIALCFLVLLVSGTYASRELLHNGEDHEVSSELSSEASVESSTPGQDDDVPSVGRHGDDFAQHLSERRDNAEQEVEHAQQNRTRAWDDYRTKYNSTRRGRGENRTAFDDSLNRIAAFNSQNRSCFFQVGPLTDMDDDDFRRHKHGLDDVLPDDCPTNPSILNSTTTAPDYVNWVEKKVMTPVKDQGQCGSCWTFATTAAVEAANTIHSEYTTLFSLSEQQLLDCASESSPGGNGCQGNSIQAGFTYTISNGGLTSGGAYPYTGVDGSCRAAAAAWKVSSISSYTWVPAQDEDALMKAVAYGPVIVGISASTDLFKLYGGGVISDFAGCCPAGNDCATDIDHAVVVVGYNKTGGYWLLRNSWGPDWGMDGYFMLAMGKPAGHSNGMCGILRSPVLPTMGRTQPPSGTPPANTPPLTNLITGTAVTTGSSPAPSPSPSAAANSHAAAATSVLIAALAAIVAMLA